MSRDSIKIFIDKFRQIIYNKLWTSYVNGRRLNPALRNGGVIMGLFEAIQCIGALSAFVSLLYTFYRDYKNDNKKK